MFHLSESRLGNGRQSSHTQQAGGLMYPSLWSVCNFALVTPANSSFFNSTACSSFVLKSIVQGCYSCFSPPLPSIWATACPSFPLNATQSAPLIINLQVQMLQAVGPTWLGQPVYYWKFRVTQSLFLNWPLTGSGIILAGLGGIAFTWPRAEPISISQVFQGLSAWLPLGPWPEWPSTPKLFCWVQHELTTWNLIYSLLHAKHRSNRLDNDTHIKPHCSIYPWIITPGQRPSLPQLSEVPLFQLPHWNSGLHLHAPTVLWRQACSPDLWHGGNSPPINTAKSHYPISWAKSVHSPFYLFIQQMFIT